jgi:triacylglycerol lipase
VLAAPGSGAGQVASPPVTEHLPIAVDAPLLLVPGWRDDAADIDALRREFVEAGWGATRVRAVSFADPVGSNVQHAREIADAVDGLRLQTGAERVDIVAHSMGGLAVRHYLHFEGGDEVVRRVVFLGTPHRGTVAAMLAWGEGGREMVPGSDFLERLQRAGRGVPEGVEALAIRTPTDLRVIPASSAVLAGAPNLEICCPSHQQLIQGGTEVFMETVRFLTQGTDAVAGTYTPREKGEWGEQGRFGSWTLWGEGRAEETLRRFFFPSWSPASRSGDGEGGGAGGGAER